MDLEFWIHGIFLGYLPMPPIQEIADLMIRGFSCHHTHQEARARQLRDNISVAFCGLFLLGAFAVPLAQI